MYLWTQRGHFSHAKVEAFHFGLWYICCENDDLMVFQILCSRRITPVREEEERVCNRVNGYRESKEGTGGGRWRVSGLPFGCDSGVSRKVELEKRGKGGCGSFQEDSLKGGDGEELWKGGKERTRGEGRVR